MGEFFQKCFNGVFFLRRRRRISDTVSTAAVCLLAGVTVLVWDRNETLISDRPQKEETSTSADSFQNSQRRQGRLGRERKAPAADAKLRKKLASLEESETKTKKATAGVKQKVAQFRKR